MKRRRFFEATAAFLGSIFIPWERRLSAREELARFGLSIDRIGTLYSWDHPRSPNLRVANMQGWKIHTTRTIKGFAFRDIYPVLERLVKEEGSTWP